MKQPKKLLLATALLVPLLSVGLVRADTDQHTTTTNNAAERKTTDENLTLPQRLEKYKTQITTRLNNAQKQRLQTRCKAAQGKLSSLRGRLTGLETSREATYSNLFMRLSDLKAKLEAKGIDTTTYTQQVAEVKAMIDLFQSDLAKYRVATADLAELDCAADPDAFKAALETARAARLQVVKDGQDIRSYLKTTIKPTLEGFRSQLAVSAEEN